jgi:hypothetical protein
MKKNKVRTITPTVNRKRIGLTSPERRRGYRKNNRKVKIATQVPAIPGITYALRLAISTLFSQAAPLSASVPTEAWGGVPSFAVEEAPRVR